MKQSLAILLMLSSTALIGAENLPTPANSTTTMSGSNGSAIVVETKPAPVRVAKPAGKWPATAEFKADLAFCKSLAAEEKRDCERETYAARSEGLYR